MKTEAGKICLAAGLAVPAALLSAGYFFFQYACRRTKRKLPASDDPEQETELQKLHREAKAELLKEPYIPVEITSYDGLKLKGKYYPCPQAERAVMLVHGYMGSAEGNFGMVWRMLKERCSLLLIDERACGDSEGEYITFGAEEKKDIVCWAEKLAELTEGKLPLYLFGISMGASAVLMTADRSLPEEVKGIIADCGYSSMKQIISETARDRFGLPSFPLVDLFGFFCRITGHFRMEDADAEKALRHASLPVLFFHGTGDDFVRVSHTERNAAACASEHTVVLIEDAPHGSSAAADPEKYREALYRFFAENEKSV